MVVVEVTRVSNAGEREVPGTHWSATSACCRARRSGVRMSCRTSTTSARSATRRPTAPRHRPALTRAARLEPSMSRARRWLRRQTSTTHRNPTATWREAASTPPATALRPAVAGPRGPPWTPSALVHRLAHAAGSRLSSLGSWQFHFGGVGFDLDVHPSAQPVFVDPLLRSESTRISVAESTGVPCGDRGRGIRVPREHVRPRRTHCAADPLPAHKAGRRQSSIHP